VLAELPQLGGAAELRRAAVRARATGIWRREPRSVRGGAAGLRRGAVGGLVAGVRWRELQVGGGGRSPEERTAFQMCSGDWRRSGVVAYTIVLPSVQDVTLGKPVFYFFISKSDYFLNGYYFLLTLCRVLNCRHSAKVTYYFMSSFSLFLFKTMFT